MSICERLIHLRPDEEDQEQERIVLKRRKHRMEISIADDISDTELLDLLYMIYQNR